MGTENETSQNNPNKGTNAQGTTGKDKTFKESELEGFEKDSRDAWGEKWKEFYTPDLFFHKGKTVVVLESSSTGDRKAHIGELTQFLSFVNTFHEQYDEFYFALFLCGSSENPPKPEKELERLQFFYDELPISEDKTKKIEGIYVIKQETTDKSLHLSLDEIKKQKGLDLKKKQKKQ